MKIRNTTNILMELRKICQHPYLSAPEMEDLTLPDERQHKELVQSSGKLAFLKILLPKLKAKRHRVLLFSQFKIALDRIEDFLYGEGYAFLRLDGDAPQAQRQKDMDAFNAPDSPFFIFLLTTRAGGVGINLATADTVIVYDPDFNPHQDLQAIARSHRYGQNKKVLVFKLMTKDSVEEKIIQAGKRKMVLDHLVVQNLGKEGGDEADIDSMLLYGAKALYDTNDDGTSAHDVTYNSKQVDEMLEKVEKEADDEAKILQEKWDKQDDMTEEEKLAAMNDQSIDTMDFSFAKIWEMDKGDLGEVGAEEEVDEDAVEAELANELRLVHENAQKSRERKRVEELERDRKDRRKKKIDYYLEDSPRKKKNGNGKGKRKHKSSETITNQSSDSEFQVNTDEPSDEETDDELRAIPEDLRDMVEHRLRCLENERQRSQKTALSELERRALRRKFAEMAAQSTRQQGIIVEGPFTQQGIPPHYFPELTQSPKSSGPRSQKRPGETPEERRKRREARKEAKIQKLQENHRALLDKMEMARDQHHAQIAGYNGGPSIPGPSTYRHALPQLGSWPQDHAQHAAEPSRIPSPTRPSPQQQQQQQQQRHVQHVQHHQHQQQPPLLRFTSTEGEIAQGQETLRYLILDLQRFGLTQQYATWAAMVDTERSFAERMGYYWGLARTVDSVRMGRGEPPHFTTSEVRPALELLFSRGEHGVKGVRQGQVVAELSTASGGNLSQAQANGQYAIPVAQNDGGRPTSYGVGSSVRPNVPAPPQPQGQHQPVPVSLLHPTLRQFEPQTTHLQQSTPFAAPPLSTQGTVPPGSDVRARIPVSDVPATGPEASVDPPVSQGTPSAPHQIVHPPPIPTTRPTGIPVPDTSATRPGASINPSVTPATPSVPRQIVHPPPIPTTRPTGIPVPDTSATRPGASINPPVTPATPSVPRQIVHPPPIPTTRPTGMSGASDLRTTPMEPRQTVQPPSRATIPATTPFRLNPLPLTSAKKSINISSPQSGPSGDSAITSPTRPIVPSKPLEIAPTVPRPANIPTAYSSHIPPSRSGPGPTNIRQNTPNLQSVTGVTSTAPRPSPTRPQWATSNGPAPTQPRPAQPEPQSQPPRMQQRQPVAAGPSSSTSAASNRSLSSASQARPPAASTTLIVNSHDLTGHQSGSADIASLRQEAAKLTSFLLEHSGKPIHSTLEAVRRRLATVTSQIVIQEDLASKVMHPSYAAYLDRTPHQDHQFGGAGPSTTTQPYRTLVPQAHQAPQQTNHFPPLPAAPFIPVINGPEGRSLHTAITVDDDDETGVANGLSGPNVQLPTGPNANGIPHTTTPVGALPLANASITSGPPAPTYATVLAQAPAAHSTHPAQFPQPPQENPTPMDINSPVLAQAIITQAANGSSGVGTETPTTPSSVLTSTSASTAISPEYCPVCGPPQRHAIRECTLYKAGPDKLRACLSRYAEDDAIRLKIQSTVLPRLVDYTQTHACPMCSDSTCNLELKDCVIKHGGRKALKDTIRKLDSAKVRDEPPPPRLVKLYECYKSWPRDDQSENPRKKIKLEV